MIFKTIFANILCSFIYNLDIALLKYLPLKWCKATTICLECLHDATGSLVITILSDNHCLQFKYCKSARKAAQRNWNPKTTYMWSIPNIHSKRQGRDGNESSNIWYILYKFRCDKYFLASAQQQYLLKLLQPRLCGQTLFHAGRYGLQTHVFMLQTIMPCMEEGLAIQD